MKKPAFPSVNIGQNNNLPFVVRDLRLDALDTLARLYRLLDAQLFCPAFASFGRACLGLTAVQQCPAFEGNVVVQNVLNTKKNMMMASILIHGVVEQTLSINYAAFPHFLGRYAWIYLLWKNYSYN